MEDSEEEEKKDGADGDEENDEDDAVRQTLLRGHVLPSPGCWGSCVRLVDPSDACSTIDCVKMGRNEAAVCCASVCFHSRGGEILLTVGTVTGMTAHPLGHRESHVALCRVVNGERLQLLHRTSVEGDSSDKDDGGGGPVL